MAEFGQFHDGFLDGLLTEDDAVQFYLSTQERERFIDEAKAVAKLEEARKHLVVLEINPSYGASCIILAESVELLHCSL
jgi:hypothetical protein